jgi:predicted XRE-type DNA-binding protein
MAPARASTRRISGLGVARSPRGDFPVQVQISYGDMVGGGNFAFRTRASSSPKHSLAAQINRLLDAQHMNQIVAAERMGISQSKISAIRNYKLHGISLERLLQALVALDQRVAIVVKPRGTAAADAVSVVI